MIVSVGLTTVVACIYHPAQGLQSVCNSLLMVEECTAAALRECCRCLHVSCNWLNKSGQLVCTWFLHKPPMSVAVRRHSW